MKVEQIHLIVNNIQNNQLSKIVGEGNFEPIAINCENWVSVAKQLNDVLGTDRLTNALADQLARMVFVDRLYMGEVPNVMRDSWEYGSIVEKIRTPLPEAVENPTWKLENGKTYNQDIFKQPEVVATFFNDMTTYEIDFSYYKRQLKSAFQSLEQLDRFLSMMRTAIQNSFKLKNDGLVMATIGNMIAETLHTEFPEGNYGADSKNRAVNLLHLYKAAFPESKVTAETCLTDPEFIRYATNIINQYVDRLARFSTLFNIQGTEKFTPRDLLHVVMLTNLKSASEIYLQAGTFNAEMVKLPYAETVPYWQSPGSSYSFNEVSEIHINSSEGNEVAASGILAVMFDHDAIAVCCEDMRVESHYNAKAEFINDFYKMDARYCNDFSENFVVFYVADAA